MSQKNENLNEDLKIIEVMVANMKEYLDSDILFWPTSYANLPKVTLGGYLMREHRLQALRELLDAAETKQLEQAVHQFDNIVAEKGAQFKEKAQRELAARIRQWQEALRDLKEEGFESMAYYQNSIETREMIAALTEKLHALSASLPSDLSQQVAKLDDTLRQHWQPGAFMWPAKWQSAYPQETHWWLYGQPHR